MDRGTDGRTDTTSNRDATAHLKIRICYLRYANATQFVALLRTKKLMFLPSWYLFSENRVHKPKQDWRAITVGTQPKETLLGVTHKIPKQNGNTVTFSGVMLVKITHGTFRHRKKI